MGRVTGRRETELGEGTRDEEVELAVLADFRRGCVVGVVESAGGNVVKAGEVGGECSGEDNGEEKVDIALAFSVN
jgi:hypothetical protein